MLGKVQLKKHDKFTPRVLAFLEEDKSIMVV